MWICIDGERVTGANYNETLNYGWLRYEGEIPEGFYDNCCDYAYRGGELVYDPLPEPEPEPVAPTQLDRVEAQTLFTALMTDTLLEEV